MANKKEHILKTAYDLFLENGYDNTTMAAIGKKADVSVAHAYLFFENKEDLLEAAIRKALEKNQAKMARTIKKGTGMSLEDFVDLCFVSLKSIRKEALFVRHSVLTPKLNKRISGILGEYNMGVDKMFEPFFPEMSHEEIESASYTLYSIASTYFMEGNMERGKKAALQFLEQLKK